MRFRAVVQLNGKTATGIEVPAEVVEGLGGSKRPAVNVTINGYGYRSTVASMGGRHMLPISAEHRQGAGVAAGDEVEVALELDTAPREVTVPADLAAALDGAPEAKRFFDGLSYSRRLRYVLQVEGAKKAETRQRRVADTITRLANGEA
ncbi:YdeI/OmpD-associated family protein [Nonomuraea sp. NPDC049141]|uniref:YdeI/OmpD-associated family protein n=1 Tax=unclassified Nonomuraea TaxID=2593643 RepID=UPI0033D07272